MPTGCMYLFMCVYTYICMYVCIASRYICILYSVVIRFCRLHSNTVPHPCTMAHPAWIPRCIQRGFDDASSVDSTMHPGRVGSTMHPAWIPRCIQRGFHDASSSVDSTMHHPAWIPRCIIQGGFHDASSRVDSTMRSVKPPTKHQRG